MKCSLKMNDSNLSSVKDGPSDSTESQKLSKSNSTIFWPQRHSALAIPVALVSLALVTLAILNFVILPDNLSGMDPPNSYPGTPNLGNGIIEANVVYAQLGGTFGKSTSETVKKMQKGETKIVYTSDSASAMNVVGVSDFKCSPAKGCQEVVLVSIDLINSACYYVRIDKTVAITTTSSTDLDPYSQAINYGNRKLKSGEAACKTSDKVSNWQVSNFPPVPD